MQQYLRIMKKILKEGKQKQNRTEIDSVAVAGVYLEHHMSKGFPLLTTKKIPFRLVASELEFFIKGITDKKWLQERNNHIWDEWCSKEIIPYSHDPEIKKKMMEERDLGPVYGFQWRHFGANYMGFNKDYSGQGVDQLENLVKTLKSDRNDRGMLVTSWNPTDLPKMALRPCHYGFQVDVIGDEINLFWNQRSIDTALGLPFNLASYALLLHLLAKESGLKEGKVGGFLVDTHLYVNHLDQAREQVLRKPKPLCNIVTPNFTSIFDWKYTDTTVVNYEAHPHIKYDIAV